ncbi:alkene reductase [Actinoplanes rectilineatus]|uniref:alkene reductase n=1 Tax=Actinoplanes rectilineatus TaxID=113571 RepID=UPI0005F27F61|nr:alkene reductase [Actinoplanes rectilineatus]
MAHAFDSFDLGGLKLANRIVMAPMTRSRAKGRVPGELQAAYYAQRASAGLIVTESTQPSPEGQGFADTPGLHSDEQVAGWRTVTDAVHAAGGVIFAQLTHTGRISHPSLLPDGLLPVGPSAVAADGKVYTAAGAVGFPVPVALDEAGIARVVEGFERAARNAIAAGFDGVEIQGSSGYLIQQFLSSNANLRDDAWGGSIEGRVRFGAEVARAVATAIGGDRVGFRISPDRSYHDIVEENTDELYATLLDELTAAGIGYLHLIESPDRGLTRRLRDRWAGAFILNPHTKPTGPESLALIEDGLADLVAFGTLFLANPDLPARLAAGGPFNEMDRKTAFGGGERGYTDYPALPA